MPISYKIDVGREIIMVTGSGRIEDAELLGVLESYSHDDDYRSHHRVFGDYSKVTDDQLSAEGIKLMAMRHPHNTGHRVILVHGLMEFGFGRMYQTYCECYHDSPPLLCYDRAEAVAFLNQDLPPDKWIA